ncbi:unnamed protein product [Auanema sp. JU1783]|nr:unnamed protein product [Auanema sp. JU1783]
MSDKKNLKSMQRIDPCAVKILDKAAHSALYKFQTDNRSWEKTDVCGTMFIYQRADKPYYSLMIVNRQSLSDFIEPIHDNTCISRDKKFIFMRKSDGEINCVWVYDETECLRIFKLLERLTDDLKKGNIPSTNCEDDKIFSDTPVPPPTVPDSNNLLKMLKAAQSSSPNLFKQTSQSCSESLEKECSPTQNLPVLLQKLLIQEQPKTIIKTPATIMTADELEKDLCKDLNNTAKPKHSNYQDFLNSSSAVSLVAMSTRSVHGSEADQDGVEVESVVSGKVALDDPNFAVGSGSNTPLLDKSQFITAFCYLMQNDDEFVAQIHQAYTDAINRRLRLGGR